MGFLLWKGLSHPLGPLQGNAGGMAAFDGPFSPRGRALSPRQAEQAFSQSVVTNPWAQRQASTSTDQDQTRTSTDQDQTRTSTDRGAEPSFISQDSNQGRKYEGIRL